MSEQNLIVRWMDAKIDGCSYTGCVQKFDKLEIGALAFWQERDTDRPWHWTFGGTRCMSCIFENDIDTEKYRSQWYYATRSYAESLGLEPSDISVNEYSLEELNEEARDEGYLDYNEKKKKGTW